MAGLLDEAVETEAVEAVEAEGVVENPDVASAEQGDPSGDKAVDHPVRPDFIPENFWDATKGEANVEGLAKSYAELRKAFNERNNDKAGDSVDAYNSDDYFSEDGLYKFDGLEIQRDDPGLQAAMAAAVDAGLGVKQAHTFIQKYMEGMKEHIPAPIDMQAEMDKLGENAQQTVAGIKIWVDGMKQNGDINDEVYDAILDLGKNAAGIKALNVLRQKTGEMAMPTGEAITGTTTMSLQDWYSASYETHAEGGESRASYDARMREVGRKLIGNGHGTFDGSGYGPHRKQ